MTTTFLDLGQKLVRDAGISGSLTSMVAQTGEFERVVNWIKDAVKEIEGLRFDWDFLHTFYSFNTTIGVRDYTPPSDHNLWDVNTAKIEAEAKDLPYILWTRKKRDVTEAINGDPYMFTVLPNKSIRLYDTPTSIVQIDIEYWKRYTTLTANTDEPAIPEQFRDIIVYKALQYYANYESADEVKVQALENYQALLAQLQAHSLPANQAKEALSTGMNIQVTVPYDDYGYY
jgi:hypothetical protein